VRPPNLKVGVFVTFRSRCNKWFSIRHVWPLPRRMGVSLYSPFPGAALLCRWLLSQKGLLRDFATAKSRQTSAHAHNTLCDQLPLGNIAGLLGMNVGGVPGLTNPNAFAAVVISMIILTALERWFFKRGGWFDWDKTWLETLAAAHHTNNKSQLASSK